MGCFRYEFLGFTGVEVGSIAARVGYKVGLGLV